MLQVDPLLITKFHIPYLRKDLVVRPRLISQLVEGLHGPLTLVTAPAGYGKTTLVASGLATSGFQAAWLSLDKEDNRVDRFLAYLVQAFREVNLEVGAGVLEILASGQTVSFQAILPGLINDLDRLDAPVILVLDDYQQINHTVIHEGLTYLLDNRPEPLHLVIITRSDPPIPLARLRARGQMLELRVTDLRFTTDEAASFINEVMGLDLPVQAVSILEQRTEGWAAGLQMAALSMRNRTDIDAFIAGFSGTNRYILDYLLEEVLAGLPPGTQRFLLFTSILQRMSAPLCDALLHKNNSEEIPGTASADLLKTIERENLFLVALDDERLWYRYHHLFAELLQSRLNHLFPSEKLELHRRAADWLEKEGMTIEAVNHALAGGAHDQAARLVEENTTILLARGELQSLMHLAEALPEGLRQSRPWLCIHQAYALAFAGKLPGVEEFLTQAETAMSSQEIDPTEEQAMRASIAAVRAMTAVMAGREKEAIVLVHQAREWLSSDQDWDRATMAWALGYAQRSLGHLNAAGAAFEEMIFLARKMGNLWTLVSGLMDLAMVTRSQGQLVRARALFEEALREASQQGAHSLGYLARMEAGLASILYEQNELDQAQRFLTDAFNHMSQWPNPNHLAYAYTIQSRVMLAQGKFLQARDAIYQANQIFQSETVTRINRRLIEAALVRVWLKTQNASQIFHPLDPLVTEAVEYISAWETEFSVSSVHALDEGGMVVALMLARVLISNKQADDALLLLNRVRENAIQKGNLAAAIEAQVLTTVAQPADNAGLSAIEEALRLGQRGGFTRVFLDEGRPLQLLLAQWLARFTEHPLRAYALYLIKLFVDESSPAGSVGTSPVPAKSLPEALTQREMEVLNLIAQGLTNGEIALQLVVSTGTVKAHTAAIYRKLDVAHRTEAVACARKLGLLP
jgi:LuxR family transcriptional regulator, maltose regulon positive regulatory protein